MKLIFKTMKIHNFLSFKDEEFDFSENRGMVLICGKNNDVKDSRNGSGKSSLFQALIYGLFGQLQNKIRNENLHNRYVPGTYETSVNVTFFVGDDEFRIFRGLNKYGASFLELYKIENGEETNITRSSIAETNSFIENEILNCDISIFLRTIFLSSDQNYNFFRLKPQPKKEFIDRLFNITIFGDMYNLIHRDILQYDKTIYGKQNNLLILNKNETNYKEKMDEFSKRKIEDLKNISNKLDELLNEYNELKKIHIQNNSEKVSQHEDSINKLNEAKIKIRSFIKDIENKSSKLTKSKFKLESSRDAKQKLIDQHSELLGKLCEKCQPIVADYYDLSKYADEISNINLKIVEFDAELKKINDDESKYSEKLEKIENKIQEINEKINELTFELNEQKIKFSKYETQISNLNRQKDSIENSKNPYEELYEDNHNEILKESKELEDLSNKYNYLKYAESIVSQDTLKKFIIKDLVQLLNVKIKYYLTRLGSNYTCVFDENMDYEFITEGGTCEYDNFSSGERMRLMIAASFAFKDFMATRSNIISNILILDEFIDSNIDKVAIDNIMKILHEFTCIYNQSVYVISHRKEIDNSIFDNIIQIVKTNNISEITYLPNEKN